MKNSFQITLQYAFTIFLSSFLLFQVQPLIGKMILPWFGGSASVWTTCMLFFQMVLLLGYVYSHWIVKALSTYQQSLLHIALLVISLFLIPIGPNELWKPSGAENPTFHILGLLLFSIGLPYFVLSTTGPLIQAWFAREKSGTVPYRLFALSNLGSMLALLAYPLAVEPIFSTQSQSFFWSGLFACFVLTCSLLAWRNRNGTSVEESIEETGAPPKSANLILWICLAACPSILMVADTSFLTENIAPIPLLWVAPLALYLLSFIFCFERQGWYQRKLILPLLLVGILVLTILPTLAMDYFPIYVSMGINLFSFFMVCMACHGELALRQPHPKYLTIYFLMLAVGGALGGLFVGVIAPFWFNGNYELSVGIVLSGIVVAYAFIKDTQFKNSKNRLISIGLIAIFLLTVAYIRVNDHREDHHGAEVKVRNFYGSIGVYLNTENKYRTMEHGQISHGRQYTEPARTMEPTTYYIPKSGVGKAIEIKMQESNNIKVGVVGLGVGTLAAYGRKEDNIRFYEINPQVIDLAYKNFTFLEQTPASIDMVLGDARLKLESEPNQQFDVLVIDAFSGDSVPVHLLTTEAFSTYLRHLKPNGVLAIHITNRFLDLRQVMKSGADSIGADVRMVYNEANQDKEEFRSHWALISKDPNFFSSKALIEAKPIEKQAGFKPWTDSYSSLISVLY